MSEGAADLPATSPGQSLGTVAARRADAAARRQAARERDRARYTLADGLAAQAPLAIPPARGFATAPPGEIAGAAEVVEAANTLIERVGNAAGRMKGGYLVTRMLDPRELTLVSPYLRFALGADVVATVAAYLGLVPILNVVDLWYSPAAGNEPRGSQRWHIDHADTTQVKVFVHCSHVDSSSGPLTVLDARRSDTLADALGYDFKSVNRVSDEQVSEVARQGEVTELAGPAGTVAFVDTSRCFHFGSRVRRGAAPRRVVMLQFVTPYAFDLLPDHRDKAPFRHLAADAAGELERLVLGAA